MEQIEFNFFCSIFVFVGNCKGERGKGGGAKEGQKIFKNAIFLYVCSKTIVPTTEAHKI